MTADPQLVDCRAGNSQLGNSCDSEPQLYVLAVSIIFLGPSSELVRGAHSSRSGPESETRAKNREVSGAKGYSPMLAQRT